MNNQQYNAQHRYVDPSTQNMHAEPSAPPPPSYNHFSQISQGATIPVLSKGAKITALLNKYEIDNLFSEKLGILDDFDIVFLFDDSGSMKTPITGSSKTRWDELKEVANICFEISTIFDDDGIDIYFLNRVPLLNVSNPETLNYILNEDPYGRTPLTKKCNEIFEKHSSCLKPLLLVIATDGIPTDNAGHADIKSFEKCMKDKNHSKTYVSFLACSDSDDDVGYLNRLDRVVPNVDTLDDYHSELKEVKKAQGSKFKYSLGDHTVRLLLGPICPELDSLDEKKLNGCSLGCNSLCNIL